MNRQALLLGIAFAANVAAAQAPRVRPGIDVLLADSAHLIAGRRLGLISNQTGIDARGVPTIDRLALVPGARLVALFAPEHGIRGAARPGEPVSDGVDVASGLPIYSLYGANRAPTPAQLAALDVLMVDLQDVGASPFTYVATTVLAMRAAAAAGRRVIVLDRPNPIGCAVQGPVLDTSFVSASFIRPLRVPLRHGLTIGELARLANAEERIGADLVVVPVSGWSRCTWFDETGLPWVRPSPNLPDLESIAWYPGTVLFEATNLSVGRGTSAPFRQVGAPWLDPARVAAEARRRGVRVTGVAFTPQSPGDGRYDGVSLRGVRLSPLDRRRGDPIAAALRLLDAIATVHPDSLRVERLGLARRLGTHRDTAQLTWPEVITAFLRRREPYLLYH